MGSWLWDTHRVNEDLTWQLFSSTPEATSSPHPPQNVKTSLKRSFEERHGYTDAKETWKSAAESDRLFPEGLKSIACQLEQNLQQTLFLTELTYSWDFNQENSSLYHLGSLSSFNSGQLRRAWETYLELARGKMTLLYPLLSLHCFFPHILGSFWPQRKLWYHSGHFKARQGRQSWC